MLDAFLATRGGIGQDGGTVLGETWTDEGVPPLLTPDGGNLRFPPIRWLEFGLVIRRSEALERNTVCRNV